MGCPGIAQVRPCVASEPPSSFVRLFGAMVAAAAVVARPAALPALSTTERRQRRRRQQQQQRIRRPSAALDDAAATDAAAAAAAATAWPEDSVDAPPLPLPGVAKPVYDRRDKTCMTS